LIHSLPGAVLKPHERGERDVRLDATLNLTEFRKALIHFILHHNRSRVEGYRPRDFMVTDAVAPRPVDLWEWGIANRSGHLLERDHEFVRQNLLPGAQATVTERGIRFRGLYYTCDRAVKEQWFAEARQKRSWRIEITYDPRSTSTVYLRLPEAQAAEGCKLMQASAQFEGRSWEDVDDFFAALSQMKEESRSRELQSGANYRAQIDDLVNNAKAQAEAGRDGQSKAARIRGIRANRKIEREIERRTSIGDVAPEAGTVPANVVPTQGSPVGDAATDAYVGPPRDLETLEQQREEICKRQ